MVRARVERFGEPALLVLLARRPTHGYELLELLPELSGEDRVDVGNLYRTLRSLEDEGIVASEWSADLPGPTKRTYTLTDEGHDLLASWLEAVERASRRPHGLSRTRSRREVTMCGRHHRRRRGRRAPNREELLTALEERQKDLEQEIADIHDVLRRLRDEGATPSARAGARDLAAR